MPPRVPSWGSASSYARLLLLCLGVVVVVSQLTLTTASTSSRTLRDDAWDVVVMEDEVMAAERTEEAAFIPMTTAEIRMRKRKNRRTAAAEAAAEAAEAERRKNTPPPVIIPVRCLEGTPGCSIPTIAVVTPSTLKDYSVCHEILFKLLNRTRVFPDDYVFSISHIESHGYGRGHEIMDEIEEKMRRKYPRVFANTNVVIVRTDGNMSQGANRNLAIRNTNSEIISSFDADDYAHPDRIAYIRREFTERRELDIILSAFKFLLNCDGKNVMWNWRRCPGDIPPEAARSDALTIFLETPLELEEASFDYPKIHNMVNRKLAADVPLDDIHCCSFLHKFSEEYANGWASFRRKVWESEPYMEEGGESGRQMGEDTHFILKAVISNYTVGVTRSQLGVYNVLRRKVKECPDF
eukprot:TRINITY_DN257_c0_g5_i1.p1 TRINITY_DN257_c0_g5~~TRINITY_DN257_c0_g5_i1.p1  ORF type:complete len:417 (+),score=45.53 TRINITY_DN257_c0_g5_i1:26-1252(+)